MEKVSDMAWEVWTTVRGRASLQYVCVDGDEISVIPFQKGRSGDRMVKRDGFIGVFDPETVTMADVEAAL